MVARTLIVMLMGTLIADVPLSPADVQAHRVRMLAVQGLERDVETALSANAVKAARRSANQLVPILADELRYWDKSHLDDALDYAQRNLRTAKRLSASIQSGKLVDASTELDALRGNCVACHGRHPENRVVVGR